MSPFPLRNALQFLGSFILLVLSHSAAHAFDRESGLGSGVRVAITASAYRFQQPAPEGISDRSASFAASAVVVNGSRTAVPFTFPQGLAEGQRLVFRLFNAEGDEVWRSEPAPSGEARHETLRPGASWKRAIRIPLAVDGVPLPLGTYSLEAGLANGDPVHASTMFEVVPRGGSALVSGFVLNSVSDAAANFAHSFAAGAVISAEALREAAGPQPQSFFGPGLAVSGPNGQFSATIQPGRYRFNAVLQASTPDLDAPWRIVDGFPIYLTLPAFQHGSATASAGEAQVCRPVIMLSGAAEKQRIYGTGKITLARNATQPATFTVSAEGVVNTGGWSGPMLVSQELTAQGILILDFMARPPGEAATQAFETVACTATMPVLPGIKGVRVRSRTNAVTALMPE